MKEASIIGLDLSKRSFQAHGALADGSVAFRKKLTREKVLGFLAEQPRCTVAMEACGSAHHWGRAIRDAGHEVRLIPPAYVKPFVKRQKNDAADAEAIAEAASRPTMRFVAVKTEEQQARAMLFRTRDLLVRQRTQLINALRGQLSEHGVVAPQGPANVTILAQAIDDLTPSLPLLVVELARVYLDQIDGLSEKVAEAREGDSVRSQAGRHDPSPADNAGRWANYSHGDRDLRAAHGGIPPGARFRSLARAGSCATLDRRQAGSRENFENGAARYSPAVNHRRNGHCALGLPEGGAGRNLAASDARTQTAYACGDRPRQQNGPFNLGHADKGGRLSSSCGCDHLIHDQVEQPRDVGRVRRSRNVRANDRSDPGQEKQ